MARCIYGDLFGKQSLTKPQPLERERERAAKKEKSATLYQSETGKIKFTKNTIHPATQTHKREPTYPVTKKHGPR
jgi:hypothetical protein